MKQLPFFALFLLAALSFTACVKESASSVDQDRIHTEYELFYDANSDKTFARATFRFSNITGTKLELDAGTITFDGEPLTFNGVLAYYEKEYAGLKPGGTFSYTDNDGNTFVNTAEIRSIGLPASLDSIARSAAFNLTWTGAPLAANENVTASLNNNNAINPQLFFQNDLGATSVVLDKNKLETLFAAPATLAIERRYVPAIQQATSAGGVVTGRYRAKEQGVVLF